MKTAEISSSLTISYEEAGEGIPLVLLHAFPLNAGMWADQIKAFQNDFRVLAPNLRGLGKTSSFIGKPSIQTLTSDLEAWLEALDIYDGAILCGLSMGGYVALEFARSYPERLRGLILADTRADADSVEARKARNEMIAFAQQNTGAAVAEKMLPKLLGGSSRQNFPRMAGQTKDLALANPGVGLSKLVEAMRDRRDSTEALPGIQCPTLVIGGSEDVVSPPEVMSAMAERIPNARHVVVEGAGHLANLEQPQKFNEALRNFLLQNT